MTTTSLSTLGKVAIAARRFRSLSQFSQTRVLSSLPGAGAIAYTDHANGIASPVARDTENRANGIASNANDTAFRVARDTGHRANDTAFKVARDTDASSQASASSPIPQDLQALFAQFGLVGIDKESLGGLLASLIREQAKAEANHPRAESSEKRERITLVFTGISAFAALVGAFAAVYSIKGNEKGLVENGNSVDSQGNSSDSTTSITKNKDGTISFSLSNLSQEEVEKLEKLVSTGEFRDTIKLQLSEQPNKNNGDSKEGLPAATAQNSGNSREELPAATAQNSGNSKERLPANDVAADPKASIGIVGSLFGRRLL